MPSFESARQTILDLVPLLSKETVPVLDAVGRVLAGDVVAPWDMPRWSNSAMDGFAVRSADCAPQARLRVTGYLPAGGRYWLGARKHIRDKPAPGEPYGLYGGTPDHAVELATGAFADNVDIVLRGFGEAR